MDEFILITKAIADQSRIRALIALEGRELCVCQIIELLNLAPSTISKHMSILKVAQLVQNRKQGRWNYYRLAGEGAPEPAREAIAWILRSLKTSPEIAEDRKYLKEILKIDREELCHRMTKS